MADNFEHDLVVVGAGSGGLVAAGFAAQLGAHVAVVEKHRVGGDCTWTGCVPSKALLRVARAAHEIRTASRFGVHSSPPQVEMTGVRDYLRSAIQEIYKQESPELLESQGIELIFGEGRFVDPHTMLVGERKITGKSFLLCTGARPHIPDIPGFKAVPYLTYEQIFDNDRLPSRFIVIGGGPIGVEIAQAYIRLGAGVTIIDDGILPADEPDAQALMREVLLREGIEVVQSSVTRVEKAGDRGEITVTAGGKQINGDMLLVATGRTPVVDGLDLEKAGVKYSQKGIGVDEQLRTSARHIYAAGDCSGGYQFTHFAGWQAFQAARNALLPGSSKGFSDVVPWVTYTDPEVAHVGLLEAQARERHGDSVTTTKRSMSRVDRAVCEGDIEGFIQVVHKKDGTILGATVVAARAGEVISELALAMKHNLKLGDIASAIHPYPTYSIPLQQIGAEVAISNMLEGLTGKVIRNLSGLTL